MIDRRPPFGPDELPVDGSAAELAGSLALGRELAALAGAPSQAPGEDFTNQVMGAIALEPVPQPSVAAARAARSASLRGLLAALRDAWRVATGGAWPAAVRVQALALVLVAIVGLGAVLSAGAVGVAGALGWFRGANPPPVVPIESPSPSVAPSPTPSPSAPSPSPSVVESPSPSPTGPTPRTPTPSPTDDETASPDETDGPDETDEPDETEKPDDDSSGPGGGGSGNSGPGSGDDGPDDDSSGRGSGGSGG